MPFRDIPSVLNDHFRETTTTLATIWKITRPDGKIFRFTDADVNLKVDGDTYQSINAGTSSTFQSTTSIETDNLTIEHVLDSDEISLRDLTKGLFDHSEVEIHAVNFRDTSQGKVVLFRGYFGEVTMRDDVDARVELKSLSTKLTQQFGRNYLHTCDAELGDNACGIDLDSNYEYNGTVDLVVSNQKFGDSSFGADESTIENGILEFTSGLNAGAKREIRSYSKNIPISSIDAEIGKITLNGNEMDKLPENSTFDIVNSKYNDGTYTVASVSYTKQFGEMTKDKNNYYEIDTILDAGIEISGDPFNLSDGDDSTDEISDGDEFFIEGSKGYDGSYEVRSVSYSDGTTTINTQEYLGWPNHVGITEIMTEESIPSSLADGEISYDKQGMMEMWFSFPYKVQVGDSFKASAGCDKTLTTCKDKFDNVINFRGFPHIPGRDEATRYPDSN